MELTVFFTIRFTLNPINLLGTEYLLDLYEINESLVTATGFKER